MSTITATRRDWTQCDILEEAGKRHTGPGFFNVLYDVTDAAFSGNGSESGWESEWQFPMGELTVGQVLDFFGDRSAGWSIKWHNESGGPDAYIVVGDYDVAEQFRDHFKVKWLDRAQVSDREDEDTWRAGAYGRP